MRVFPQNVLHANAPGFRPHLFEYFQESRRGECDSVLAHMAKRVIAVRLGWVGGIQSRSRPPPCAVGSGDNAR